MKKAARGMIAALMTAILLLLLASCGQKQESPATEVPPAEPEVTAAPEANAPEEKEPIASEPKTEEAAAELETVSGEPIAEPEPEPEPEPVAEILSTPWQVYLSERDLTSVLSDGDYVSGMYMYPGDTLRVVSEEAFSSLYIEWRSKPEAYNLLWDGGSQACGEYGFLQEYIRLPEPVTELEFELEIGDYLGINDITLLSEGTAPEGMHDWLPPHEEADILVFPTHSDDDVLFFGTLISWYTIEQELKVQTAFMVEHIGQVERGHERLNGLWEMGIRNYPILFHARDTASHNMGESMRLNWSIGIEEWQVEMIRRFRPLVVVGHDLNGEYGNGGHKLNAYYLVTAVEKAADPEQFPESAENYGVWDTPKFYVHLYEENEIILDPEIPMENDPMNRTPFQVAKDAFEHHHSQKYYSFRVQYGEQRIYDCRPFGLYRTLVGYDTTADIMENINAEDWR